jgi:hypothetical protein
MEVRRILLRPPAAREIADVKQDLEMLETRAELALKAGPAKSRGR